MWASLLPKFVGGTLIDDDGPDQPTTITGFKLDEKWVEVVGEDFSFGGVREFFGISADHDRPNRFYLHGYGMSATIIMPGPIDVTLPGPEAVNYDK